MTTFHPQQFDCGQCAHQKADASALQISVTNCTAKLRSHVHEAGKIVCNNISSAMQKHDCKYCLYAKQALPLVWTRFLRLANSSPKTARSPARRSRDGRATSGKTTGEISRFMAAQRLGNGRAVATAMPPNICQDDSQVNLPYGGLGPAMIAPETCETTRELSAQQPRNGRGNISQLDRGNSVVSSQQ